MPDHHGESTVPIVCKLEDIKPESGKEVRIDSEQGVTWLMLFVCDSEVLAYQNSCPHEGRALNFAPDRFILTKEGQLVCPHHGATFELGNGLCVSGPCKGKSLKPFVVSVVDDEVRVGDDGD